MRKKVVALMLAIAMALTLIPAISVSAEEKSLDDIFYAYTNDGASECALIGATVDNNKLIVLLAFYNGSSGNSFPMTVFSVNAFQGGVQLQPAILFYPPKGFESSATQIQPGITISYYEAFQLRNDSPVEIQISKLIDFTGDSKVSYTFAYDDLINGRVISKASAAGAESTPTETETEAPDWEQMYNNLLIEYNVLKDKYITLLESNG